MQETGREKLMFLTMMSIVMTLGMEGYNLILLRAISEHLLKAVVIDFPLMLITVMLTQSLLAGPTAGRIASILMPENVSDFGRILIVSICTVCLMCPLMSFAATIYFKHDMGSIPSIWLMTFLWNLPMAFFWQILIAGPLVRRTFRYCFR